MIVPSMVSLEAIPAAQFGNVFRPAQGRGDLNGPRFDVEVPPDGYAWWYVDGISDDGRRAISIIGLIGAVFSPWYHWSGRGNPANHCCINVATYGRGGRFAMTDRSMDALQRRPNCLTIGPSTMRWDGSRLTVDVNEISSLPLISRMRGRIVLTPRAITGVELPLTPDGAHVWRPFGPCARIDVDLEASGWRWSGHGYFDANFGTRRLERDFLRWTWARFPSRDGALCLFRAQGRGGVDIGGAFRFGSDGLAYDVPEPPQGRLPTTLWGLRRTVGADRGTIPRQAMSMLGGPFYNRAAIRTTIDGERMTGVHETLDLQRYGSPVVKAMVAMRVPRRRSWNNVLGAT